ncbi:hypothetical protein NDU88_002709 [Pleurodeles waltl]|uniref:Uncharacterized protein n=1 Tax=Pleurodeles waltl TaxID=8319 RepID=A0AAV7T302_PLEWA|nr:hypothetical protein NDU88_002709 [Pleurodeles waltl]
MGGGQLSRPRLQVLRKTPSTGQNFEDWAGGASPRADNSGETWHEEERCPLGARPFQDAGESDQDREKTQGTPGLEKEIAQSGGCSTCLRETTSTAG